MRLWTIIKTAVIRFIRHMENRCLVCGRDTRTWCRGNLYRYCSLECAAYDGALSDPRKSRVLVGTIMKPKPHYEASMREE